MKKLLLIIALICLIPVSGWGTATVPTAATVWEFQQDATAGAINSCAFDGVQGTPGTDWTLYPTCRYSWKDTANGTCAQAVSYDMEDDLACTNAADSVCTSAALANAGTGNGTGFLASDVGNYIYVVSGTKAVTGRYLIKSVAAGAATVAGNVTDATGDSTAITANLGGACPLPTDALVEEMTPGNTAFFKYSATEYDIAAADIANSEAGTMALPFRFIGYNTTRTVVNNDALRPTIDLGAQNLTLSNYNVVRNIQFKGSKAGTMVAGGTYSLFVNSDFVNAGTGASVTAFTANASDRIINCKFKAEDRGIQLGGGYVFLFNNYIYDSATCAYISSGNNFFFNNILDNCSVTGISFDATNRDYQTIIGNTFHGNTTAAGSAIDLNTIDYVILYNNIFSYWTAALANLGDFLVSDFNNYIGNTGDGIAAGAKGANDIALTTGFPDPDAADFRVGANMKAKGLQNGAIIPGTNASALGYTDMGALQRVEPTSTGGGAWGN